ncbi:hypothetical protein IFM89_008272 [Coptis chinensis]|uniref:Nicastrin n=1 Tax=Coptis chinensis TaxID=261450 RepID=A0A835LD90_9MAGN|nr:hypothetical protein IFM89_008272 [Coptis chinensis]
MLSDPDREKVVAPVVRLKDVDKLTSPSAVLVSQDEMENFFNSVLNDHHFAKKVAGVLVEFGTEVPTTERGFSPVEKFPQVKFAPYKNVDYIWNSAVSHEMHEIYREVKYMGFYLGSRRFLAEVDMHLDVVHGLNRTLIELGSSAANKTFDAFQYAHESLGSNIKISMANKSNPGIPPSSLMSFLRKDSSISRIVLEDFNTAFTNKFYHSRFYDLCEVCIRSKRREEHIVVSTTRYIPAYSTRLKFEYGVWHVLPPDASDVMVGHGRPSMDRASGM